MIGASNFPPEVECALDPDYSVIPVGLNKKPLLPSWREFQIKRPDSEQIRRWQAEKRPPAWAIVTGAVSRVCILDFDGAHGENTMHKLGINPHRRTGSGGYHWQFTHPEHGCKITTVNGKTKRELGRLFPGMDVRGEGGYAVMCGRSRYGEYHTLRELSADPFDALPSDLKQFLLAPKEGAAILPNSRSSSQVTADLLLNRAIQQIGELGGRNAAGFWLAVQLRDNGYHAAEASSIMRQFVAAVPATNVKGQTERYTQREALASLNQAYQRSARAPWKTAKPQAKGQDSARTMELKEDPLTSATPTAGMPAYDARRYVAHQQCLYWWKASHDGGHTPVPLTNFEARIIEDRIEDDGTEQSHVFVIETHLNHQTRVLEITAKDFTTMNWVSEKLGAMAIVFPNQGQHARTAIQQLSGTVKETRMYKHTGWTMIDDQPFYLHADGAIGAQGSRTDVLTSLTDTLPLYRLPVVPISVAERQAALRASLDVLDVAPDRLTFPVLAAVYRAILGPATFSFFLCGISGVGKSQLAALAQQHFGAGMDAEHLPASWQSSGGANMTLAFCAKDALLLVDDFVLTGHASANHKLTSEADKLLRGQGNLSGRRTLTTEHRLKSDRPPRGLIGCTGEHTPRGSSLNARMVILPFPKGGMNWERLTRCQEAAVAGELAKATACFIQWAAQRLEKLRRSMSDARSERRQTSTQTSPHMRTPDNLHSLQFGLETFLQFALEERAIDEKEYATLQTRSQVAFDEVKQNEAGKHSQNDSARLFLRLLNTALLMGRAHLEGPKGGPHASDNSWGWAPIPGKEGVTEPHGALVGWLGDEHGEEVLYIEPESAFTVVVKLSQERGEGLPGSAETIRRDLCEQGFLKRSDIKTGRRTYCIRKTLGGAQQEVLPIARKKFTEGLYGGTDNADNADNPDTEPFFERSDRGS